MKYFLTWFGGIVLGVAAALAALYYNPLTSGGGTAPNVASTLTLSYGFPEPNVLALSHNEQLKLAPIPEEIPLLWESGIDGTALSVLALADSEGQTMAVASRVSVPSLRTNLLLEGILVDDYWLITVADEGSLFVRAQSNYWPLFKETVVLVGYLRRPWSGPRRYAPTAGPRAGRFAEVIGATGRFAGRDGTAQEFLTLDRYSAAGGFESMHGQLLLALDEEPAP